MTILKVHKQKRNLRWNNQSKEQIISNVVNLTKILRTAFLPIFIRSKIQSQLQLKKAVYNYNFLAKKATVGEIDTCLSVCLLQEAL